MGILSKLLKAQSHMPHPTRKGQPRWIPDSGADFSIEMGGRYGTSGPESLLINKRLENDPRMPDMSVEGVVDLQILNPQLKVTIKTGVRDRIKRVLKFLGD